MHKIKLHNIEIFAYHGVYDYEKADGQIFYLDIEYSPRKDIDLSADRINNVIDYTDFIDTSKKIFTTKRYSLIETLATEMINQLSLIYNLLYIKIIIRKKMQSYPHKLDYISIEIEKNNV